METMPVSGWKFTFSRESIRDAFTAQFRILVITIALALAMVAGNADAQEPPVGETPAASPAEGPLEGSPGPDGNVPDAATLARQVEVLTQQVYDLTKQLRQLEVKLEVKEADQEKAAKKLPKVDVGAKGLSVSSGDDAFQMRVRLRLAHDFAWFKQDSDLEDTVGREQDGTGFRYARLRLQGKFWKDFEFNSEFEFAGENGADSPRFMDVYMQYNAIPYGGERLASLRVGHFKEPFSLEELTAISDLTFMENPLTDVFVPSRNVGVQLSDAILGEPKKERLTWALGVFKETTDDLPSSNDLDEDQGWQITGRVTGLPWYADDGRKLLHLGFAYSHRNPDGAVLNYRLRPESRLSLFRYIDPDAFPAPFRLRDAVADDVDLFAPEVALVLGPFSLQGEYVRSNIDTLFGGDVTLDGYYAQASYFLTGENRPYRHENGVFGPIEPRHPFRWHGDKGVGAWEVALRYATVDMSDGPINGGEHTSYTLGLNWYLNPNFRVMLNYIRNEIEHPFYDDAFDVLQTRFQLEF